MSAPVSIIRSFSVPVMFADKLISLAVLFSLGFSQLRADITMMSVYLFLFPYLIVTGRRHALIHLIAASLVACCWFFIAREQYGYNREMLLMGGYTVYPLFAWAVGLFGVYLMFSYFVRLFANRSLAIKFLLFVLFYWMLLFGSEILAYHFFCFRNIATANYEGLPGLDCIHVPDWMKVAYLMNGPLYYVICELSGFPDPNVQVRRIATDV